MKGVVMLTRRILSYAILVLLLLAGCKAETPVSTAVSEAPSPSPTTASQSATVAPTTSQPVETATSTPTVTETATPSTPEPPAPTATVAATDVVEPTPETAPDANEDIPRATPATPVAKPTKWDNTNYFVGDDGSSNNAFFYTVGSNGKAKAVYRVGEFIDLNQLTYLGVWQGALYFADDFGVAYVKLDDPKKTRHALCEFSFEDERAFRQIYEGAVYDGYLYFGWQNSYRIHNKGLYRASLDGQSFDNAELVVEDAYDIYWNKTYGLLYYLVINDLPETPSLFVYNMQTKQRQLVADNVIPMGYWSAGAYYEASDHVFFYTSLQEGGQETLMLFDVRTAESKIIAAPYTFEHNSIVDLFACSADTVFFADGSSTVYQYKNGVVSAFFEVPDGGKILSLHRYYDDCIYIMDDNHDSSRLYYYIINGKLIEETEPTKHFITAEDVGLPPIIDF